MHASTASATPSHLQEDVHFCRTRDVRKVATVLECGLAGLGVVLLNLIFHLAVERRLVIDRHQGDLRWIGASACQTRWLGARLSLHTMTTHTGIFCMEIFSGST